MSRPGLTAGVIAAVAQDHVNWFPLVKMEFDSAAIYVAGTDFDVDYGGQTWLAARGLGSIDPIVESGDEIAGLKFTLAGVSTASIAEAQTEKYQGRPVTVLWCCVDSSGTLNVDPAAWQGRMDVPTIERSQGTCTISITAEHRMVDWQRPRKLLFNHADQQRIAPGDNFFLGLEAMAEKNIVLFSKEALKR